MQIRTSVQMMENKGQVEHVVSEHLKYRPIEGAFLIQGNITWNQPPVKDDGWFALVIIDKRVRLKPHLITAVTADGKKVKGGEDGVLNKVAEVHPWLEYAGSIPTGGNTSRSGGQSLSPGARGVTFVASFPVMRQNDPGREFVASGPIALDDIVVGLIYIGEDRQIYWAERLFG